MGCRPTPPSEIDTDGRRKNTLVRDVGIRRRRTPSPSERNFIRYDNIHNGRSVFLVWYVNTVSQMCTVKYMKTLLPSYCTNAGVDTKEWL